MMSRGTGPLFPVVCLPYSGKNSGGERGGTEFMNDTAREPGGPTAENLIIDRGDRVLVTGANGFIGSRVVRTLLSYGFAQLRCVVRSRGNAESIRRAAGEFPQSTLEVICGNLLSRETCLAAAAGVSVVYHLAAGTSKSFAGCVLNSVVTTRNLLDALVAQRTLKRFVNISSLAVYSNERISRGGLLDESCVVEHDFVKRYDPYAYGKAKQDEIVLDYARNRGLPYVIVRPGLTFGPGKDKIPGRVGIDTFGVFLHLGLANEMPFTYVDNCAEAIVLAGLVAGVNGEVFNIVDDQRPRSRDFLNGYKKRVARFTSIPVPYRVFYLFNYAWEKYSSWSGGQLPPAFNRLTCAAYFKGNTYSNKKAKSRLSWRPRVCMSEGLSRYFAHVRSVEDISC